MKLSETYTPFSVVSPVDSSPQMYPSASLGVEATDCVKPTHPPSSDTPAERVCELLHSAGVHNCRLGKQRQRPTKKASLSYIISRHTHTHTHTHTHKLDDSLPCPLRCRCAFSGHTNTAVQNRIRWKIIVLKIICFIMFHMFHYLAQPGGFSSKFGDVAYVLENGVKSANRISSTCTQ